MRGVIDAVITGTKINGVQIKGQNFIFGIAKLEINGQRQFLHFPFQRLFRREKEVFDELLGDRAGAFFNIARLQVDQRSPGDSLKIKAGMRIKAGVLNGDNGLDEAIGQAIDGDEVLGADTFVDSVGKENQPVNALPWGNIWVNIAGARRRLTGRCGRFRRRSAGRCNPVRKMGQCFRAQDIAPPGQKEADKKG